MRIGYLGNFSVPWCTEVHVAASLEALGHEVARIQEGETRALDVPERAVDCDVFLHTQTFGLAVTGGTIEERFAMLDELRFMGIPTVGFHLDRWFGLDRQIQVPTEPFFRVDHLFTADGGHQAQWEELGINHHWSPPAVFHGETDPVPYRTRYHSEIAFVGNWKPQSGYHPEWSHRYELVRHLQTRWRRQVRFFPKGRAVRGRELQDLYASGKVFIGDSCLVPKVDGSPMTHYISDRVPESLGRGAFLLHPWVEGIDSLFEDGVHLRYWNLGDWDELDDLIAYYLAHDDERKRIAEQGRAHVRANHTYKNRMETVLRTVCDDCVEVAA